MKFPQSGKSCSTDDEKNGSFIKFLDIKYKMQNY